MILCNKRSKAKDYNRFIHQTYTQYEKATPAIVGRIQYDYIDKYNNFRKRCKFWALFFKKLPLLGDPSKRMYDLYDTCNCDIDFD